MFRFEVCSFTGFKIPPGRGITYVRGDSKAFRLSSSKAKAHFLAKKNPRQFHWTVYFRRANKKGTSDDIKKKRGRKVVKAQRAILGLSQEDILARRNQSESVRQTARLDAIKNAKEQKRKERASKKKELPKVDAHAMKMQQSKAASKQVKGSKVKPTSR